MLLVPEQIVGMKHEISRIDESYGMYKEYLVQRNAATTCGRSAIDTMTEDSHRNDKIIRKNYEKLLEESDYLYDRCYDHIDIGTKFKYSYVNEPDVIEEGMLVETLDGVSAHQGFISVASPLGKTIYGAGEGDLIKIEGPESIEVFRIVEIIKNKDNYINFIRSNPYNNRKCLAYKEWLKKVKDTLEYERRLDITISQEELLMSELKRIAASINHENKKLVQNRVAMIMKHLKNREIAKTCGGDVIGIGTKFDCEITTKKGSVNKHLEMINIAVSDELDSNYVERISLLGNALLGLGEGDEFSFISKSGKVSGYVYNIENEKIDENDARVQYQYKKKM